MLRSCLSQAEYLKNREERFENLSESEKERYRALYEEADVEYLEKLDDEALIKFLVSLYSNRGSPGRDPKIVFYSYYLYVSSDEPSLDKWATNLKTDPVLKALIGLKEGEQPPSVGTHYNFNNRFLNVMGSRASIIPTNEERRKSIKRALRQFLSDMDIAPSAE